MGWYQASGKMRTPFIPMLQLEPSIECDIMVQVEVLMQSAIKLWTTVLAGRRIAFDAPELPEGTNVELIILLECEGRNSEDPRKFKDVLEFIDSRPERRHTSQE